MLFANSYACIICPLSGCEQLNSCLDCLASEYSSVKFCRIDAVATGAAERFSSEVSKVLETIGVFLFFIIITIIPIGTLNCSISSIISSSDSNRVCSHTAMKNWGYERLLLSMSKQCACSTRKSNTWYLKSFLPCGSACIMTQHLLWYHVLALFE